MFDIKENLSKLPDSPGVYLMKDKEGTVIYVGKAISLKNRVRSYFRNDKNKHPKVASMVSHIDSFEYILVGNEVEALILESNLIKDKKPKYNILLRDDKTYPYIKITNEKFPRIMKTRQVLNDKATYFGPYPNAFAVNEAIDLFHFIFPFRTCKMNFEKDKLLDRPCMYYYVKRCLGPCIAKADEKEYLENIKKVKNFLNGKTKELTGYLRDKMFEASKDLNFEIAAKYRDSIEKLEILNEKQRITSVSDQDADIIAFERGDRNICVQVFFMRSGKILDREFFILDDDFKSEDREIMSSFLKQFYMSKSFLPKNIFVEIEPSDLEILEEFFSQKEGHKILIKEPKRGEKLDLISIVKNNAKEKLEKFEEKKRRKERLTPLGYGLLKTSLDLKNLERIESYDISNISGAFAVASMVVYTRGVKTPKEYRKFKIKTVKGPDDYASMREVLSRRFDRYMKERSLAKDTGFNKRPDLVLMDGGKGQISVCQEVLKERNLHIPVAGLVKDDKHRTRAILYKGVEIPMKVSSPLYRFVFAIQEEVHRFAINYHRSLREKNEIKSVLDDIKGVGKTRKIDLMKHFKTIEKIKEASLEELLEVESINSKVGQAIIDFFNKEMKRWKV